MENKYFDQITRLLGQACPKLTITHRLEFKNVFGAVGGYVDGNIFISCGRFGVALRLPPEILESFFKERDVKHLKYFPNGHIKKEYAVLPKKILDDKQRLRKLVVASIKYAGSLKYKT